MARSNTGSTSNWLKNSTNPAPVEAAPLSISCWFYPNALTATMNLAIIADDHVSGDEYFALIFDGANAYGSGDNKILFEAYTSGGGAHAATSTTVGSASAWYHACGVTSAANARAAYLNGGGKGTNTTSITPSSSINSVTVGAYRTTGSTFGPIDGRIAEVGVWNVALSDAEVLELSKGASPLLVRPNALVAYWPLVGRTSPEPDDVGNFDLTISGTMAQAAHVEKIILPHRQIWTPFAADTGLTISGAGGIASEEAFGTARLDLGLALTGLSSGEAHGTQRLDLGLALSGIASAEAHGTQRLDLGVATSGVASGEAHGSQTVAADWVVTGVGDVASAEAHGTQRLDLGLALSGVASSEAHGSQQLDLSVTASGVASAEAHGTQRLDLSVTASGVASGEAHGAQIVATGTIIAGAGNVASEEAIGSLSLTADWVISGVGDIASGFASGTATISGGEEPPPPIVVPPPLLMGGGNLFQSTRYRPKDRDVVLRVEGASDHEMMDILQMFLRLRNRK